MCQVTIRKTKRESCGLKEKEIQHKKNQEITSHMFCLSLSFI